MGIEVGHDARGVVASDGDVLIRRAVHELGADAAFADGHGQHAGQSRLARSARGKNQGEHPVLAQSLHQRLAGLSLQKGALAHLSEHIPQSHDHADGGAAGILRGACCGQRDGEGPAVAAGENADVLERLKSDALAHESLSHRLGHKHVGRGRRGRAGGGNTGGEESRDELFHIVGVHQHRAAGAVQFSPVMDARRGFVERNDGAETCTGRHAAARAGDGGGNQEQPAVAKGFHAEIARGGDNCALAHFGVGFVLHDDHVQHTTDRVGRGACADAGGCREVHEVCIGSGGLAVAAERVNGAALANGCKGPVVIGDGGCVQTHTHLGGGQGESAADQTGIGVALREDLHITADIDDAVFADEGLHQIGEVSHGDGAGHGGGGILGRGRNDAACNSLHIVVGGGEEVHQIDGIQEVFSAEVDGYGIGLGSRILLDIQNALFLGGRGAAVGGAGVGNQRAQILSQTEIAHIHTELLRFHGKGFGLDAGIVADAGENFVLTEDGGHAGTDAHGGAAAEAHGTGADGQLGLVVGRDDNVTFRIQHTAHEAFRIVGRLGFGLGDQNGEGAADGHGAAVAGDAAGQSLRAQRTAVLVIHVLA